MEIEKQLPPKPKLKKRVEDLSYQESLRLLKEIEEYKKAAFNKVEELKTADPFWFYEPSTGEIPPKNLEFLRRHLKPEDIPQRLDGQLDVHLSTAPIRGASGGNQAGKTAACCVEAFIKATGEVPDSMKSTYPKSRLPTRFPQHIRVVGKDWQNGILLNVLPTYQRWVPKEYLKEGRWDKSYSAERATLYLQKKGQLVGTIEFMSNAQDVTSFQGPPRDMVIYDEEPRKDIYKENLLRFTTRDKLDILFGMTPTEGLTWIYEDLINKGKDTNGNRVEWFKIPSVTNKRANLRVLDEIMADLSYEEKKMRILGEFISLSGLVYGRTFSRKIHLIDPFDVRCNCNGETVHDDQCPHSKFYVLRGIDPHLVTPTAVVWLALDRWGNKYVVDSWFECTDIEAVKRGIKQRSEGMRLGWSVVDSAADSNIEAFGGLNIFKKLTSGENKIRSLRLAVKGQGSIKTGVDEIKQALNINPHTSKPTLFVMNTPGNSLLANAFETMERDRYANEDKRGQKDRILESKYHNHAALRYLFMQKLSWRDVAEPQIDQTPDYQLEEIYS